MSKKRLWIYLIVCLCLLLFCIYTVIYKLGYVNGVYKIEINSMCISNNSVGNEWTKTYVMDGAEIKSGVKVVAPLKSDTKKTIKATITEYDKIQDEASENISFYLGDGERNSRRIVVTEKGGRYSGNKAVWQIEVTVKLVRKTLKKA